MQLLEILGRIGFDWQVALANLVNFLIIFWILKRFVFRPMSEVIQKRREAITKGLEERKQAEEELNRAEIERAKIIDSAKLEARSMVEGAKEQESLIVAQAKERAQKEAEEVVLKARKEMKIEKHNAESELRENAARLVSDAVRKIIEEEISREKAEKFVRDLISDGK